MNQTDYVDSEGTVFFFVALCLIIIDHSLKYGSDHRLTAEQAEEELISYLLCSITSLGSYILSLTIGKKNGKQGQQPPNEED